MARFSTKKVAVEPTETNFMGIEGVDDWWQNQSLLIDKIRNWHI